MQTPITSGSGSSRRSKLALVQIDHLYPQHQAFLLAMVHAHYSIAILEDQLIRASLRFMGADYCIKEAWAAAYVGLGRVPDLTPEATLFARELLRSIKALWSQPPFDRPEVIVYEAKRHGYIGMALAVEVIHREPLPSHPHPPSPTHVIG